MRMRIDQDEISPDLERTEKILKPEILRSIGNIALSDIQRNFTTQGRNIGDPWPPLSELTNLWRTEGEKEGRSNQPLMSTGAAGLMGSIHQKTLQNKVEIRTNKVVEGVDIARVHNEGVEPYTPSKKQIAWFRYQGVFLKKDTKLSIPQRQFMLLSESAKREIVNLPSRIVKQI